TATTRPWRVRPRPVEGTLRPDTGRSRGIRPARLPRSADRESAGRSTRSAGDSSASRSALESRKVGVGVGGRGLRAPGVPGGACGRVNVNGKSDTVGAARGRRRGAAETETDGLGRRGRPSVLSITRRGSGDQPRRTLACRTAEVRRKAGPRGGWAGGGVTGG